MKEYQKNRSIFLSELRSGKYKKGTIQSDDRGRPITNGLDSDGYCACAIMCHLFGETTTSRLSLPKAVKALGLTARQCTYIQREINDTPLTFSQIADRIEKEVF